MTSHPSSPQESDSESSSIRLPKNPRGYPKSPLASDSNLPYRHKNASLSGLFASTTSLPSKSTTTGVASPSESRTVTPPTTATNGSVFSPSGSTVRSSSPANSTRTLPQNGVNHETRDLILRAFSPHVSILASQDTEELVRHKGIHGGLLELLRPFGERIPGKVTIRDSSGSSKSYEDFAVRFVGVKDGLEGPKASPAAAAAGMGSRNSAELSGSTTTVNGGGQRASAGLQEYKPARLRTGGDVQQIEELVERHLTFAEEQSGPFYHERDYLNHEDPPPPTSSSDTNGTSPFYILYLRRLLSGLPLIPSETFSHPIASVIAISSRSQSPIEDLRTLYASSNTGEHRLPSWVHNEFLRYYLLIHDEDYDDLQKSVQLYEQMKRHFGLHCHLLRLRSKQCSSSSPTSPTTGATTSPTSDAPPHSTDAEEKIRLPLPTWLSAAEELQEITRRETSEDDTDLDLLTPYIFTTDSTNIRAFVRELVTQSLIPSMERASANWNDQVASRRRGLSGRFMSLSKRFTAFGGGGGRVASLPTGSAGAVGGGYGNYDSLQGSYRPDAPEATMRRLADYSMMLRDYKLARGTYEILCQDFKNDKAWRYYAGANEMGAIASLIVATSGSASAGSGAGGKAVRAPADVEAYLENAYYTYTTRLNLSYPALRGVLLAIELLQIRGGSALDSAAHWATRILEDKLVGPVGHVLVMERLTTCYNTPRKGANGEYKRRRKGAFWSLLASEAWLRLEKGMRAEECLTQAVKLYGLADGEVQFDDMARFLRQLQDTVKANRSGPRHVEGEDLIFAENDEEAQVEITTFEPLQQQSSAQDIDPLGLARRTSLSGASASRLSNDIPTIAPPAHRKSLSLNNPAFASPPPSAPQPPPPLRTSFDPLGASDATMPPAAYNATTPTMAKRQRAVSAASVSSAGSGAGVGAGFGAGLGSFGAGTGVGAGGLNALPEDDAEGFTPVVTTPASAVRRRDPREEGFE